MKSTSRFILYFTLVYVFLYFFSCQNTKSSKKEKVTKQTMPSWKEGYLDIHHINTGAGDATYFIFPDATTLLFDAGSLDKTHFETKYAPLKATSVQPNKTKSVDKWLAEYIKKIGPPQHKMTIDYALVSHFHEDHYGSFVDLAKQIPFKKVIDRNYPNYNFPLDLKQKLSDDVFFQKYSEYVNSNATEASALIAGSSSQITLQNNPNLYSNFKVKNIKVNGTIAARDGNDTITYFTANDMTSYYKGGYNENPLSLAIKLSYGKFDYFTGGDNTGLQGYGLPNWFDVETPIAKAVGKVEATTLNHHGNRDATNAFFVKTLNPKVIVQQSWCSDHPGQEVYQRLIYKDSLSESRQIFATNMHKETFVTYGPWFKNNYKSTNGHVVIRVYPKGEIYRVFVLDSSDDKLNIKNEFGPFKAE